MQLIVTQPVFLWLFGIVAVLVVAILIVMVVIFVQLAHLLGIANEKAEEIGETIDEVRSSIHQATEAVNETRERIANFATFTTSAAGIAKLVGSVRDHWTSRREAVADDDLFNDEPPVRRKRSR